MRNATTVRIFAVLIGFVLALSAAAEAQNSSTLKTGPVSTDQVASSCSSASTLVDLTSPASGGIGVGLSTPRDADPLASVLGAAVASSRGLLCVVGDSRCLGKAPMQRCGKQSICVNYLPALATGYNCYCDYIGHGPWCDPRDPDCR